MSSKEKMSSSDNGDTEPYAIACESEDRAPPRCNRSRHVARRLTEPYWAQAGSISIGLPIGGYQTPRSVGGRLFGPMCHIVSIAVSTCS
jgi:hypothetical protein